MFIQATFLSLLALATATPSKPVSHSAETEWDYIVAGGGPAGIIAATRLAEANYKVLLLERGGPTTYSTGGNASATWNTKSSALDVYDIPSQYAAVFSTGVSYECTDTAGAAGCLFGGGVEINSIMFVRPAEHDFDDKWPTGWKWNDIEAAADRLYSRNPGTIAPSMDGKIYDTEEYEILGSLLETMDYTETDCIASPNDKNGTYSHPSWNIYNGERQGPVRSYLPIAQNLPNFSLELYTKVVRVIRNGATATAVEVEDSNTGVRRNISLASEGRVVLAAGTMSTPRILFNSGIGPASQIEVVQNGTTNVTLPPKSEWIDLPVGATFMDHPIITAYFNVTSGNTTLSPYNLTTPPLVDQDSYLANRTGAIAQSYQRLAFWDSFVGPDNETRYIQATTAASSDNVIKMFIYLTHGLTSSGSLGMYANGSTYTSQTPYFTTSADKLGLASWLDSFLDAVTASGVMVPAVNLTGIERIESSEAGPGYHYIGTAKIGTDDGRTGGKAVVDVDTRVYGMKNLFVVDASIHADLPTGNTQAPVMIVAEKAAAQILALKPKDCTV